MDYILERKGKEIFFGKEKSLKVSIFSSNDQKLSILKRSKDPSPFVFLRMEAKFTEELLLGSIRLLIKVCFH